jgi:hypothetical protein
MGKFGIFLDLHIASILRNFTTFAIIKLFDLHCKRFIRNFLAVMLLAIFALSNTPTRFLHALFANHTDYVNKQIPDSHTPQLNVSGIDCHCNSNVVITPYTFENPAATKSKKPQFHNFNIVLNERISFTQPVTSGLRGPPSVA